MQALKDFQLDHTKSVNAKEMYPWMGKDRRYVHYDPSSVFGSVGHESEFYRGPTLFAMVGGVIAAGADNSYEDVATYWRSRTITLSPVRIAWRNLQHSFKGMVTQSVMPPLLPEGDQAVLVGISLACMMITDVVELTEAGGNTLQAAILLDNRTYTLSRTPLPDATTRNGAHSAGLIRNEDFIRGRTELRCVEIIADDGGVGLTDLDVVYPQRGLHWANIEVVFTTVALHTTVSVDLPWDITARLPQLSRKPLKKALSSQKRALK
mmetsp:Transcript_138288/g.345112  ORF Transcript_138288/g.345112 Transcript_138288/m.345112 type:complete len:265 (-) Transcript_138288:3-797(-)